MSSTKKLSQKDLRQMMRERKELQTKATNRSSAEEVSERKTIDSALARYDSDGRLSCILCDERISSATLWSSHIVSKSHKNKIEEMKRKKLNTKPIETKNINKTQSLIDPKREAKTSLKRKFETNSVEISNKLSKTYIEIQTENSNKDLVEKNSSLTSMTAEVESGLPNDFFDDCKQVVNESKQTMDAKEDIEMETEMESESAANAIPKGFFDDPVMDAKARKVVFKDPIDEQWEQFQKVIAEENTVSENLIEEDIEELHIDRSLEEIEEQIANWIKVNEMQKRAELLHNYVNQNEANNDIKEESSDSEVDDQELNVFSDWRSRTGINSK